MGNKISEETLAQMVTKFRILADASRLRILYCLMEGSEMSVSQIVVATGRNQTNVSKHLKIMAEAAVLLRRKKGLQVFYRLEDRVWEQVCRHVRSSIPKSAGE
jgi:DNA-binding transcriptional ArsR family regulator